MLGNLGFKFRVPPSSLSVLRFVGTGGGGAERLAALLVCGLMGEGLGAWCLRLKI